MCSSASTLAISCVSVRRDNRQRTTARDCTSSPTPSGPPTPIANSLTESFSQRCTCFANSCELQSRPFRSSKTTTLPLPIASAIRRCSFSTALASRVVLSRTSLISQRANREIRFKYSLASDRNRSSFVLPGQIKRRCMNLTDSADYTDRLNQLDALCAICVSVFLAQNRALNGFSDL